MENGNWRNSFNEIKKYLDNLTKSEMRIYQLTYPAIGKWKGWYEKE